MEHVSLGSLGLKLSSGMSGDPARDGLLVAKNVVSRVGYLEPRRGFEELVTLDGATGSVEYLGTFGELLIAHESSGGLYLVDPETSIATRVAGTYLAEAGGRVRSFEAVRSVFIPHNDGVLVLDEADATPRHAGAPAGLDIQAAIGADDGDAVPGDCQVAYRVCFGVLDAHGRLILGSPGGRAVLQSRVISAPAGSLSLSGTTVTASIPAHGLVAGEKVVLSGADATILDGTYAVSITDADEFTFTHPTGSGQNAVDCLLTKTTRNVTLSATIPAEAASYPGFFARFYRSAPSVSYDAGPLDEVSLVVEVPVPQAVALATLARSGSTVTATTAASHLFVPGVRFRLPSGLDGATGEVLAAGLSTNVERSTDVGDTWSEQTLAGDWFTLAWTGSTWVLIGRDIQTSPTGVTWTDRTPASYTGSGTWPLARSAVGVVAGSPAIVACPTSGPEAAPAGGYITGFTDRIPSQTGTTSGYTGSWFGDVLGTNGYDTVVVDAPLGQPLWVQFTLNTWSQTRDLTVEAEWRRDSGDTWKSAGSRTESIAGGATGDYKWAFGWLPHGSVQVRVRWVAGTSGTPGNYHVRQGGSTYWHTSSLQHYYSFFYVCGNQATSAWHHGVALDPTPQRTLNEGAAWALAGTYPSTRYLSYWYDVLWTGTRFMQLGWFYSTPSLSYLTFPTSLDGDTWTHNEWASTSGAVQCRAAASDGNGLVVAVGNGVAAYWSEGGSWTACGSPPTGDFRSIVYVPELGKFVAVGRNCVATTTDGQTWTLGSISGDFYGLGYSGSTVLAVGLDVFSTSSDGETWANGTISAGRYRAVGSSPSVGIPAGIYEVTDAPDSTSFEFETASSGTIAETPTSQTVTPLSVGAIDASPTSLLGESAYWNASQGGLLSAHDHPPDAFDVAMFRDHAIYASPRWHATGRVVLTAVGTAGLQAGNTIQLPGGTITAAAAEDAEALEFAVVTDRDTDALNLHETILSICRVINRNPGLGVTAVPTSSSESADPGAFALRANEHGATCSAVFGTTQGTSPWSPANGLNVLAQRQHNVIAISLPGIPDAVPELNTLAAGLSDLAVLRVIPLRESALIFKEDGLWRLTGANLASFELRELDLSCRLLAPDTACVINGVCLALAEHGVVAVRDTGVEVVSGDIHETLKRRLAPAMRDVVRTVARAVVDESERLYHLWLPTDPSDTVPTEGWTLSLDTGLWTQRTDLYSCAVRHRTGHVWAGLGDRLYRDIRPESRSVGRHVEFTDGVRAGGVSLSSYSGVGLTLGEGHGAQVGDAILQGELLANVVAVDGNLVTVDHEEAWTLGAVDIYRAYDVEVEWAPRHSPAGPQRFMHAREASAIFRDLQLVEGSVDFASDVDQAWVEVPIAADGLQDEPLSELSGERQPRTLRVWVPRQHARCTRLHVRLRARNAMRPFKLDGLALTLSPGSVRGSK